MIKSHKLNFLVFALSILVFLFWFIGTNFNVYSNAFVGGLFELLSIPMLILLFAIPVISIANIIKNGFSLKSFELYSILVILCAAFLLYSKK